MEIIWAPWRIKYVQKKTKGKECIFCKSLKRKNKGALFLFESKFSLVILNAFPYNNGHLLVASKKHTPSLENLKKEELIDLMETVKKMLSILRKVLKPDGFNVGINIGKEAGAGIEGHLHIHIVPRWRADTNFMPICFNTKVIPQSLAELSQKLKKCLREKK
ncbi:MAG: HIT family hydrolase [Candidatus Omnitrophica bacterium 4484_70.1]|nr:MAG: HIT family hydrolase [Candidatus Omnitrophica bacterium 4484_70.1]